MDYAQTHRSGGTLHKNPQRFAILSNGIGRRSSFIGAASVRARSGLQGVGSKLCNTEFGIRKKGTIMARIGHYLTVSAIALAAVTGQPAFAQDARDESASTSPNEIVVTAQKREQRLLDVPVAITAITSEDLTTQSFNRVSDFYDRVPGLQISGQRISALSLRGITTGGGTSPTLAVLVDEVQFGGTKGGQTPIPDFDASSIERIEVLRGPQGSLYGAASLGGLIKYVLKEPSTRDFTGRIELGATSVSHGDEGWAARGTVNVPVSGEFALLASGYYRDDAAFLDNANVRALDNTNVNTRRVWGVRGAALIEPAPWFKLIFSGLYQDQKAVNSDLAITSGGVPICAACRPPAAGATTAPTTYDPVSGDLTLNALDSFNRSKYQVYSGRAEIDLGFAELTSITAWSKADNILSNDVSSVFLPLFSLPFTYAAPAGSTVTIGNSDVTRKFTQELRLAGTTDIFDWLVGGFHTKENTSIDQTLLLNAPSGSLAAVPYVARGPGTYKESAVFGTLTFRPVENFDVQVGGRYAKNSQSSATVATIDAPAVPLFGPSGTQIEFSKDNAFTWLISPTYHFSRDIMVYARVASGYRPGGPNISNPSFPSYGPDRVINYELGFKGVVVPDVVTIDTAIFQIDWKDIQLQGTAASQLTFITNGGKARSRGLEFAANVRPWTGMSINGNFTVTDAQLTEALLSLPGGLAAADGAALPFTADFTTNISADQEFTLSDRLEASVGASFTHVGARPGAFNQTAATRPRLDIPGYSTLDFRGSLTFDGDWTVTAYVRNLFDKRGVVTAQNRNGTSVPTALFIQPRTLGVTLARQF